MTFALLSIALTFLLSIISLLFKIGGKLRLTLPLLYIFVATVSTFFSPWVTQHEQLVLWGLYIIVAMVVISWVFSFIQAIRQKRQEKHQESDMAWQICKAREMGIQLDNIAFDENGSLLHPQTNAPIVYGDGITLHDF